MNDSTKSKFAEILAAAQGRINVVKPAGTVEIKNEQKPAPAAPAAVPAVKSAAVPAVPVAAKKPAAAAVPAAAPVVKPAAAVVPAFSAAAVMNEAIKSKQPEQVIKKHFPDLVAAAEQEQQTETAQAAEAAVPVLPVLPDLDKCTGTEILEGIIRNLALQLEQKNKMLEYWKASAEYWQYKAQ